jgi:hypothetical protein
MAVTGARAQAAGPGGRGSARTALFPAASARLARVSCLSPPAPRVPAQPASALVQSYLSKARRNSAAARSWAACGRGAGGKGRGWVLGRPKRGAGALRAPRGDPWAQLPAALAPGGRQDGSRASPPGARAWSGGASPRPAASAGPLRPGGLRGRAGARGGGNRVRRNKPPPRARGSPRERANNRAPRPVEPVKPTKVAVKRALVVDHVEVAGGVPKLNVKVGEPRGHAAAQPLGLGVDQRLGVVLGRGGGGWGGQGWGGRARRWCGCERRALAGAAQAGGGLQGGLPAAARAPAPATTRSRRARWPA